MNKYLLIKGGCGLGNRLLSLLSGLEYARLSGRIPVVDWRDGNFAPIGTDVFHEIFKKTPEIFGIDEVSSSLGVIPACWTGCLESGALTMLRRRLKDVGYFGSSSTGKCLDRIGLHILKQRGYEALPWSYRHISINLKKLDWPEPLVVFFSMTEKFSHLRRHYRQLKDPYARLPTRMLVKKTFDRYLELSEEIEGGVRRFRSDYFSGKMIGIHVRYTDRKGSLKRSVKDISRLRKKYPGYGIYLATDSGYVEELLKKSYPDLLTLPKRFSPTGGPLHFDESCPNKLTVAEDAMKEMLLLAACDVLVYMGCSTFSVMARALSGLPAEKVIDVDRKNILTRAKLFLHSKC